MAKDSVEYIASIEHLDKALTVVTIKGWLFLLFSIILSVGIVVWAFLGVIPVAVSGKAIVFNSNSSSLEIYGFISLLEGPSIQPGMEARCALNAVDSSVYGMIKGVVKQVLPYPVSVGDPFMQQIPSESLRQYLVKGELPSMLVVIDPILDTKTFSGFAWTSGDGPSIHVEPGMIGSVFITVDKIKPISYVIPTIRKEK